ncbi:unnamed protein product [Cylindrotheca closterium]|uniref:Smr domain-containing protein n=1 Tax=Cylindrotheca closterium TaxID=2856 RepID=A0AAD2FL49_9STRA|nr:unnamed protein product [Cylindrotheca closterium]
MILSKSESAWLHHLPLRAIPIETIAMRRQRTSLNPPQPIAEIDLHGFTKVEAIQRLTIFMDEVSRQSKRPTRTCWVLVITGSGAHSPYGPVLRTAVEGLLQKRQMEYVPQRGKGGFIVNAHSGIVFFEPEQPTDSKVVTSHQNPSLSYASILDKHRDRVRAPPSDVQSEPLPFEVAATDSAIEESRIEAQRALGREEKEKHLLKKALSMSALEQEQEQEEETKLLKKALSLSMAEATPEPNENEEEELQEALLVSQQEEEEKRREQQREEDLLLQRALSMSVLEKRQELHDEDELLQKALSLSKLEVNSSADREIKAALEASVGDFSAAFLNYGVPQKNSDITGIISFEMDERIYDQMPQDVRNHRPCR